jgi:hypothetical protein
MSTPSSDFRQVPANDRVVLGAELRSGISQDQQLLEIVEAQRTELDRRLVS